MKHEIEGHYRTHEVTILKLKPIILSRLKDRFSSIVGCQLSIGAQSWPAPIPCSYPSLSKRTSSVETPLITCEPSSSLDIVRVCSVPQNLMLEEDGREFCTGVGVKIEPFIDKSTESDEIHFYFSPCFLTSWRHHIRWTVILSGTLKRLPNREGLRD